jgi:hypothetical protein
MLVAVGAGLGPGALAAQEADRVNPPLSSLTPGSRALVTPDGRYEAGWLHRKLLGENNRALWPLPFAATVLDLDEFAGGLQVLRKGGGMQTRSLRFQGEDGFQYSFRTLDKDATRTLDPLLRESVAARVLQDQISALNPLGATVVDPLLEAAGVLRASPVPVVMPDDPALGEFREEFAGLVGLVEIRPNESDEDEDETNFEDADRITGSPRFLERLENGPDDRPDAEAFLRARAMDILVGDWDRHPDQWRWARTDERDGIKYWSPIPRDRDWALARMKGFLVWMARFPWPHYVGFDRDYPSAFHATWSGRALDRLILPELDWPAWESTLTDIQAQLTDQVIRDAVRRLPDAYHAEVGAFLEDALIQRRDRLVEQGRAFYELLAEDVDVQATDDREFAQIDLVDRDSLRVRLYPANRRGEANGPAYFDRVFRADDTREVRIYLRGNDDHAVVSGSAGQRITVRVIGGGSDDVLVDRSHGSSHKVYFYDDRGDNELVGDGSTQWAEWDYDAPSTFEDETHQAMPRDWGHRWMPIPRLLISSDVGLALGLTGTRTGYGFRQFPFRDKLTLTAAVGTTTGRAFLGAEYDFPVFREVIRGTAAANWNAVEAVDWFGFGNDTENTEPEEFYRARQGRGELLFTLNARLSERTVFRVGPLVEFFRPDREANQGSLIEEEQPFGYADFNQAGVVGEFEWDRRDHHVATTHGTFLRIRGRHFIPTMSVDTAFSVLEGELRGFVSPDVVLDPTLAVRLGARNTWGLVPFHQASYLGGSPSLRGYRRSRFGGDASVFAEGEIRLLLGTVFVSLPVDLGVYGLAGVGRVWVDEDTSDTWHSDWGGGLWAAPVDRRATVTFSVAVSPESVRYYFGYGFQF